MLCDEAGTFYTRDEREANERGFSPFVYSWAHENGVECKSTVYCASVADLLKLINRWNQSRSNFKFWY